MDMARTMLKEYKALDQFWAEAINTSCYSMNCLYLHQILKKISYELLTGKNPNVSYFRIFGSKCLYLVKRDRNSKFVPELVEGFLLGYDSNIRAYTVFNKSTRLVEVCYDVVFDEINGSQVDHVDLDELDEEEASCIAVRNKSIKDVCPQVPEEPTRTQDQPSSSLHQHKMRNKLKNKKIKFKTMSHLNMMALIKGEMKLGKTRRMNKRFRIKDHLT
jgi:hypothetical protein